MTAESHDAVTPQQTADEMDRIWESYVPPDGTTAQYLFGQIVMQANPLILHDLIIRDITLQLGRGTVEAWPERGIDLGADGKPAPDVVFLDPASIDLTWRDVPAPVLLGALEVVSPSSATMDFRDKTRAYALHRIPAYVIVDPRDATWRVLELVAASEGPAYVEKDQGAFGHPMELTLGGTPVRVETASWHPYPAAS